jgi:hypothetical protein
MMIAEPEHYTTGSALTARLHKPQTSPQITLIKLINTDQKVQQELLNL